MTEQRKEASEFQLVNTTNDKDQDQDKKKITLQADEETDAKD